MFLGHNIVGQQLRTFFGVGIFLVTILTTVILSIQRLSVTYDEPFHLRYGRNFYSRNLDRLEQIDDSKMPFSALNALPGTIAETAFAPDKIRDFLGHINAARYITILFSLVLAVFVFRWANELYGVRAAYLALFLYTFEPNILAHSGLVTTDLYITGMLTIASYYFWHFMNKPCTKSLTLAALSFGLAQIAKYSAVFLFPIALIVTLLRRFFRTSTPSKISLRQLTVQSAFFLAVVLLVINLGFLFLKSGSSFGTYTFQSALFQNIQSQLSVVNDLPLPLPKPYLQGLDMVQDREQKASGFGNMYLFGELRENSGFPGYFLYAALYKIPIVTQLLILFAILHYAINWRRFDIFRNELFLFIPIIFFTIYFNFINNSHIGIRFFLPIFPLLHVFAGSLLSDCKKIVPAMRFVFGIAALYLVGSVYSYHPFYLSYFNELALDRKSSYKILADSNIDWNQGRIYLAEYLEKHPGVIFEPPRPTSGKIVVGVNALTGVFIFGATKSEMRERYRWLRENFEPIGHIAYCYLIFDVTPERLETLKR